MYDRVKRKRQRGKLTWERDHIQLSCPHCQSANLVKNGGKGNGRQNFLCRFCRRQFQHEYLYWGADPSVKGLMLKRLVRGSGLRDIAAVPSVSPATALRALFRWGLSADWHPRQGQYHRGQIDEVWSYVGRKGKKVWLLYAYCQETDEILALTLGKRSRNTVRDLLKRMKDLTVNFFCTDTWAAFAEVIPADRHLVGNRFTRAIEGVNTWLRTRLRRLMRRTTGFSKRVTCHWAALKRLVVLRNNRVSSI